MIKKLFITNKGLIKLTEEFQKLETLDRQKISKKIAEARDKGILTKM